MGLFLFLAQSPCTVYLFQCAIATVIPFLRRRKRRKNPCLLLYPVKNALPKTKELLNWKIN
jgi:hypothetical protein